MATYRIKEGDTISKGLPGAIVLCKSNFGSTPTRVEWFAAASIEADVWVCPETVNGFYYVYDDERD